LSVAEVGRDAWVEERERIRAVQSEALAADTEAGEDAGAIAVCGEVAVAGVEGVGTNS
jgi:hypothetical protein